MFDRVSKGFARLVFAVAVVSGFSQHSLATAQILAPLNFGLISPRDVEETRSNWRPLIERLSNRLGYPVSITVYQVQAPMVQDFMDGKIDIAWMGNAPALSVVEAGAGSVFAQMVDLDGHTGYKSILVVHKSSGLQTLADVLAKASTLDLGIGDNKSTSGYLVPSYYAFQKNRIDSVQQAFRRVEVGSHQENLTRVAAKQVQVGVANSQEYAFFAQDHASLAGELRVVWESPLIPQSPLLMREKLPASLKNQIRDFVLGFGKTRDEKAILRKANGLSRFRQSSNRQLVPIADLEMFKLRQSINNDEQLTPQQREQKIRETIARGSQLELRLKLSGQL